MYLLERASDYVHDKKKLFILSILVKFIFISYDNNKFYCNKANDKVKIHNS